MIDRTQYSKDQKALSDLLHISLGKGCSLLVRPVIDEPFSTLTVPRHWSCIVLDFPDQIAIAIPTITSWDAGVKIELYKQRKFIGHFDLAFHGHGHIVDDFSNIILLEDIFNEYQSLNL